MIRHSPRKSHLISLGMTHYEAAVYQALLERGRFTAAEAAAQSGVPRQRVYDVLERLVARGLAMRSIGKGKRAYSALEPGQGLAGLVEAFRQEQEQETRRRLLSLQEVLPDLIHMYTNGSRSEEQAECLQLLSDRRQVLDMLRSLSLAAEREILIFVRKPMIGSYEENIATIRDVIGRLKPCAVFQKADVENTDLFELMQTYVAMGANVRVVERIPLKGRLFDERKAVIILEEPTQSQPIVSGLHLEHPNLVRALKLSFQSLWAGGLDFQTYCRTHGIQNAGDKQA